jgi:thioredoxin 2
MFRCKFCGAVNRVPASVIGHGTWVRCGRCKARLDLSGAPQSVNATALAEALSISPVPVLVDFSAPCFHPGTRADPVVDEVARARAGLVIALTLDVERDPVPAIVHGVRSVSANGHRQEIPTFVLFKRGQEVARRSGPLLSAQFGQWLDNSVE